MSFLLLECLEPERSSPLRAFRVFPAFLGFRGFSEFRGFSVFA
jgi:hypothetical protein